ASTLASSWLAARIFGRIAVTDSVGRDARAAASGRRSAPSLLVRGFKNAILFQKKNSFAIDVCASTEEKIAQLGRVVITVVEWIQPKKNLAAWGEVMPQIAQEKIPFRRPPAFLRRMVKIKVNRKRSDPIELLTEIGERLECANPANQPRHFEKLE